MKYKQGNNDQTQIFIDFNHSVKKAWMNTREAIIKKHKIKDKSYEKEWLSLEENNRKLDENFPVNVLFKFWKTLFAVPGL